MELILRRTAMESSPLRERPGALRQRIVNWLKETHCVAQEYDTMLIQQTIDDTIEKSLPDLEGSSIMIDVLYLIGRVINVLNVNKVYLTLAFKRNVADFIMYRGVALHMEELAALPKTSLPLLQEAIYQCLQGYQPFLSEMSESHSHICMVEELDITFQCSEMIREMGALHT